MRSSRCLVFAALLACSRHDPAPSVKPAQAAAPVSSQEAPARASLEVPARQRYSPPDLAPGERRPLLLFLHGLGSSGRVAFDGLGLQKLAERERIHLVAPDGTLDARGRRFWNAHPACCDFEQKGIDDVGRLGALLASLGAEPNVDPRRLYVAGFSNGGFMAHRLACERGELIAAIASLAGVGPASGAACKPSNLAVLEVHGDADNIVSYDGGHLFGRAEMPSHASARETFQDWARRFGCSGQPRSGDALDLDQTLPGAETETSSFEGCPGGSVALWTVRGGKHAIGADPAFAQQIWAYLSKHVKPRLESAP
ncbi:MAG TPA: PHB depolymerase family esterase [Polyangiaceae bacterium]|nr:PHB depolymerase family esterase [Polyangiaceae bacterium]